jgi:predicted nucleotidyltransferase
MARFSRSVRPTANSAARPAATAVVWVEVLELRTMLSSAVAAAPSDRAVATAQPPALKVAVRPVKPAPVTSRAAAAPTSTNTSTTTAAAPLATLTLKPLDLNLLGLEVKTSAITITLSAKAGKGQLLGNLLHTASTLVNLQQASAALNRVLGSTVDLLNATHLSISGVGTGTLTSAKAATTKVATVSIAPVHLNLLGVNVDTSPIQLSIIAHSGNGLVLGNVLAALANLFNPPLPTKLDVDTVNAKLAALLGQLNQQIPGIAAAPVTPVTAMPGRVVSLTVPPLDLNLLGLGLKTSPITVDATARSGNGLLLGNVLTTALNTPGATPQNLADLSNNLNGLLAKVVGVLNAGTATVSAGAVNKLAPIVQTLLSPTLTNPIPGSMAQVLNLVIASADGTSPPVKVDLLGLDVTTSNIMAVLTAKTGDGQVLGNLLYNVANLANPNGTGALLNLFNRLGTAAYTGAAPSANTTTSGPALPAQQLLKVNLKPLDLNLLGLEVKSDPITVTISAQPGAGDLLGNVLSGVTALLNVSAINNAINNVLGTAVDLANSAALTVNGVTAGALDTSAAGVSATDVLNLFVSPVHLNLLGLLVDTGPIHLTVTANAGPGLVLANVVTDLANVFNPPLPATLDVDAINARLEQLLAQLNQQIPGIAAAPVATVKLAPGQALSLTVPPVNVNLLGLVLKTSAVTVNATGQTGNGLLLGNVLATALNTLGATPANLSRLDNDVNALLAKVVGVLNASALTLPASALAALPGVLQTLASPTLTAPAGTTSATTPVLDLVIASPNGGSTPPVDVNLLGLRVTTSNVTAQLSARTGDGQVLGNLVYNVANLLNPNEPSTLLLLLAQLSQLGTV